MTTQSKGKGTPMTVALAQEMHLRSALSNEGYTEERINEVVLRDQIHEELLEACKLALEHGQFSFNDDGCDETTKVIKQAIAKAEGR